MTTVNISEAKAQFSRLLVRAANGETIVVTKSGKPKARLMPLDQADLERLEREKVDRMERGGVSGVSGKT